MTRIPVKVAMFASAAISVLAGAYAQGDPQNRSTEVPANVDVPVYQMPSDKPAEPPPASVPEKAAPEPPSAAAVPPQIVEFLTDQRPLGELTDKELKKRADKAQDFAALDGLPPDIVTQLRLVATTANAELVVRRHKEEATSAAPVVEEAPVLTAPAAETNPTLPEPGVKGLTDPAAALPQEVTELLQDKRSLDVMTLDELAARASKSRRLARQASLANDVRQQLLAMSEAARAELANRTLATQPSKNTKLYAPDPTMPGAPLTQVAPPPPLTLPPPATSNDRPDFLGGSTPAQPGTTDPTLPIPQPTSKPDQKDGAALDNNQLNPEAARVLRDARPLAELNTDEVTARFMLARQYAKDMSIPVDTRRSLAVASEAARQEILRREQQATAPLAPPAVSAPSSNPNPLPEVAVTPPALPPAPAPVADLPEFLQGPAPVAQSPDTTAEPAPENITVNPELEQMAQTFITTDANLPEAMNYNDLRDRLAHMRNVLASKEISSATRKALSERLARDREVLRRRLATARAGDTADNNRQILPKDSDINGPDPLPKPDSAYIPKADIANNQAPSQAQSLLPPGAVATPPAAVQAADRQAIAAQSLITGRDAALSTPADLSPQAVLNDRRSSEQVPDAELVRRLQVYRQATGDKRFSADQRAYWQAMMQRDDNALRGRLLANRERRRAELMTAPAQPATDAETAVASPNIYAAEASDQELQQTLRAAPLAPPKRRYSVREIEATPSLRNAVPHIDIDTVYFGFNKATLGPEEVANLHRIGILLERTIHRHPNEVFFIEGHTDAVGPATVNLRLSRQRAEAVKQALTDYYLIPPANLIAVGYGETYLKIPTDEPEAENRRVSISRATPLIGGVSRK